VRGAWAAFRGERGEWNRGLGEIASGSLEDAVVIDGGDVRAGSGLGLRQEEAGNEEERSGLRAEDAAGGCHGGLSFRRKSITMGCGTPRLRGIDVGWLVTIGL